MSKILGLLFPLFLIVIGVNALRDSLGSGQLEKNGLEILLERGEETIAVLNNEYYESAGSYDITYTFKVGDKEYHGEKTLSKEPTEPIITVTYFPEDPNINAANPQEDLDALGTENKFGLILGIGGILGGLALGFFRLRAGRQQPAA